MIKECIGCKENLPIAAFGRNQSRKDGLQPYCKECACKRQKEWRTSKDHKWKLEKKASSAAYYQRTKDQQKQKNKQRYKENREQILAQCRDYHLRSKYGINSSQYEQMLQDQNNQCKICLCDLSNTRIDVDHDHNTGEVRGLLCHNCNSLLGHAKDNPDILAEAIVYLQQCIKV